MPEDRLSPQQTWAMFAAVLGMVGLLVAAVFLSPVITERGESPHTRGRPPGGV